MKDLVLFLFIFGTIRAVQGCRWELVQEAPRFLVGFGGKSIFRTFQPLYFRGFCLGMDMILITLVILACVRVRDRFYFIFHFMRLLH